MTAMKSIFRHNRVMITCIMDKSPNAQTIHLVLNVYEIFRTQIDNITQLFQPNEVILFEFHDSNSHQ